MGRSVFHEVNMQQVDDRKRQGMFGNATGYCLEKSGKEGGSERKYVDLSLLWEWNAEKSNQTR